MPTVARPARALSGLAKMRRRYHFRLTMIDAPEDRLIAALKNVDAHGDVAPPHVNDPMTMVLRENAIQGNLMRWDDDRYRYVLTGTGRRRISTRGRSSAAVLTFRKADVTDDSAALRTTARRPFEK